jgi:hypothetical protein
VLELTILRNVLFFLRVAEDVRLLLHVGDGGPRYYVVVGISRRYGYQCISGLRTLRIGWRAFSPWIHLLLHRFVEIHFGPFISFLYL